MRLQIFKCLRPVTIVLFIIGSFTCFSYAQQGDFIRHINEEDCLNNLEELRAEFSKNKKYDKDWELPILAALTFYPELKNTRIHFKKGWISTSLQARPKWYFFLKKKKRRPYVILMNSDKSNPVNPHNSSFDAKVGFLTHELAHITDYEKAGNWSVFRIACKYTCNKKFAREFENRADLLVIAHGAGYLKYKASHFVFYESGAPAAYIERKRKFYFTPEKIMEMTADAESSHKLKGKFLKLFNFKSRKSEY